MLELYYERKNAKEKENKEKIKKAQKNWGFGEYKKEDEKIFISKISNFFAVIIFNSVKIIIKTNIKENQSSCFKSNLNKKSENKFIFLYHHPTNSIFLYILFINPME